MRSLPEAVRIVEVGPRDGLQNESAEISTAAKAAFIRALAAAGCAEVEATAFVNPKRVPRMADAEAVLAAVGPLPGCTLSALVANERGLDRALDAGVRRIALFTAASDTFARHNIGVDVGQSLTSFRGLARRALAAGLSVRGYVSTAFFCPYEGRVAPNRVLEVADSLLALGADEVSLGDTIGLAVPTDVDHLLDCLLSRMPAARLALHFHDTSGTALANVLAGLEGGIVTFDSSAAGLGGCPFAPGATGNLATEDLVYLMEGMGIRTGISAAAVAAAAAELEPLLGHALPGRRYRKLRSAVLERGASACRPDSE